MTVNADTIIRIEGFILRCKMPELAGNALRVFDERAALIIRLTTKAGVVGLGESWAYPHAAAELIKSNLSRHVLGQDISNPRKIHNAMLSAAVPDRRGQVHMALSAIDMAVWDAFSRSNDMSIAAMLGGTLRERVMTYASGPLLRSGPDRYDGFAPAIEQYVSEGFRAIKIRVGIGHDQDIRAIEQTRAVLGPDAPLMIDLNEGSTIADTLKLAEASSSFELAWIEEPLPHDNFPGYQKLSDKLSVPLAGGESFCGVQSFRETMTDGSLAVIQPDLAICGGFTEAMKIVGLADAFEVAVAPHVWGSAINFLASLQFTGLLTGRGKQPQLPIFEYDKSFNPLRSMIYEPAPQQDGFIDVPDGPGLGIEVNLEALEGYVAERWSLDL